MIWVLTTRILTLKPVEDCIKSFKYGIWSNKKKDLKIPMKSYKNALISICKLSSNTSPEILSIWTNTHNSILISSQLT